MSSLPQTGRFLPFTNNNIQRKQQLTVQGILPQSLSGSDTDVSTSNENLSNEDRYVIRHTARQEPQGQENQQQSPSRSSSHKENIPNIQGNLINRNSHKESLNGSNRNSLKDSINGSNRNSLKDNLSNRTSVGSNRSSLDISTSSYNTLIIHNANDENSWSQTGRLSGIVRDHNDMGYLYCDNNNNNNHNNNKGYSNSPTMQSLTSIPNDEKFYEQFKNNGCQEITDIPDDYLNQSQVLKHLAKEVKPSSYGTKINCGSTSDFELRIRENNRSKQNNNINNNNELSSTYSTKLLPGKNKFRLLGPNEKLTLSRSQPDLSRIEKLNIDDYQVPLTTTTAAITAAASTTTRPQTKGREKIDSTIGELWPATEMFQIVIQENSALKLELERCYSKVSKSQKLEQEISKVHRAHEELAASCERREKLERAARVRLQSDCKRLTELNRALRDQIDLLSSRTDNPKIIESMKKELTQRELMIGQLITQNKELVAAKERQEIELAAQRATLQEQRTHIDILDTALTNAQSNVVRLEEESRKKQMYVERVGQLQRALSSLQASSDRREETERQLRGQLERELREGGNFNLNNVGAGGGVNGAGVSGGSGCNNNNEQSYNGETIAEFKRRVRERDEKIMSLEGDVAKWEQRYLEESALRQAAIDAASLPKDAKIAALEKTSQDAEKMIAEARSEKMRHMDEVYAAQKKLTDLESRMKDLESKLAERDAMIRVLQKHTYDKESSTSSGVGSYPPVHSTHSSTSVDHNGLTNTPELASRVSTVSSVLGGAANYTSTGSYGDSYQYRKQGSFEQTNKSLDDQLKELDSQLLSKRALCCFPGFSNSGIASRKGKISKPLLASVDRTISSSTTSSKSRLIDDSIINQSGNIEFSKTSSTTPSTITTTTTTIATVAAAVATVAATATKAKTTTTSSSSSTATTTAATAATTTTTRHKNNTSRLSDGRPEDMMLLEKQGRSSQRQRMQEGEQRRAGSLPPSSLPRPPKTIKTTTTNNLRYCRLSDTETRKKSDPGPTIINNIKTTRDSGNCTLEYGRFDMKNQRKKKNDIVYLHNNIKQTINHDYKRFNDDDDDDDVDVVVVKHRDTQNRSLIPPPSLTSRRICDYGRLSDGDNKTTFRKQNIITRGLSTGSTVSSKSCGRDSGGTVSSEASISSLPPTKARSIPRPNYRIHF
ncbi:hypothetical protein HCN44_002830 [Aphidius gifuensis]|uniref:Angiomotin C-terminal domain-containing protein n=1 Tax=Aphidius gifuensis TaxID=684658 RepID=A0A834XRJ8_APHGI|nr:angiomotin-like [Aphidius gifuensis]XP_044010798.1 angiomotin-like [Aphidius gifuensis]KAF7991268.1 hypothetical protein HCN44_002830 [Aphidius gifuensis]